MSVGSNPSVISEPRPLDWSALALDAPDGLAVVAASGHFLQVNRAGAVLCGRSEEELVGTPAPFHLLQDVVLNDLGLLDDGSKEQVALWQPPGEPPREFAYRALPVSGFTVVGFRDVTDQRHRQRRVAAIARSSVKLASAGSLTATLDALASEVVRTDALAGVQILTLDDNSGLRIMGSAGFPHWSDFFDRLMECRDRGARLCTVEAYESGETVIVPDRWLAIRDDPAWQPLNEYLSDPEWNWFASVPLKIRGQVQGVLNAFFRPGQTIGRRSEEFLLAMAEQAAVAVDYAALVLREREHARREERQRLARDLHDSIVQQVFSISMQAKSIGVLGERGVAAPAETVCRIADEVGVLSSAVLADLRAMVHELRPSSSAQLGLEEAVTALAESTEKRTGLHLDVDFGEGLDEVTGDLVEDMYRMIAEAIHNVVKHAEAHTVSVHAGVTGHRLVVIVADDGCGIGTGSSERGEGYGLTTMRERAERWGGELTVQLRSLRGTRVRADVPLALPGAPGMAEDPFGESHRLAGEPTP
ncbi:signal transduction histidine kinase [Lipingzhangella halophila]|uniref:Signal transduction histidine kinase n=1 Tax=Lipingzhangella halophila TaxID=1783352 RepID=A0A7W7RGW9_9ACTN|nr:ATP-binding protein [Lipingzhangella halophila]MBB4931226.1 signal transduction histidine kinase [Lipingzhangella halophila]